MSIVDSFIRSRPDVATPVATPERADQSTDLADERMTQLGESALFILKLTENLGELRLSPDITEEMKLAQAGRTHDVILTMASRAIGVDTIRNDPNDKLKRPEIDRQDVLLAKVDTAALRHLGRVYDFIDTTYMDAIEGDRRSGESLTTLRAGINAYYEHVEALAPVKK